MDIEATKVELLNKVQQTTDQVLLVKLLRVFQNSERVPLKPTSLSDYNRELEEAEARIAQGDFATHEQVLKRLES